MDTGLDIQSIYQWFRLNHRKIGKIYGYAFAAILVVAFFTIRYMIQLSHASVVEMDPAIRIMCWYIAAAFVVVWAFFQFLPHTLVAMFGLGIPGGLPNLSIGKVFREGLGAIPDFKTDDIVKSGWNIITMFVKLSAQIPYFVIVMAAVFGTWGIENTSLVWPILIALLGVSIGVALFFKGSVWYKRVTMSILAISIGAMLYGTYAHFHPQDQMITKIETIHGRQDDVKKSGMTGLLFNGVKGNGLSPAEKIALKATKEQKVGIEKLTSEEKEIFQSLKEEAGDRNIFGVVGVYKDLTYKKQVVYTVRDFQNGAPICGIRNGTRKFSVPSTVVRVGAENWDVGASIGMNGSLQGNSFEVEGGCVTPGFPTYLPESKGLVPAQAVTLLITIE